ncbi:uncharacterized protein LOC134179317 isoform X2 [Corticium candelabrum]|uniref:uncharacterized protein LOC134179317 isoform X2 n=1 Tax=Corticium candelabrum TaxID=121492 RepID=UPI002E262812|nr:uncharacterized protein LOC134179317 isoform X2 [Corticium candelabrum]
MSISTAGLAFVAVILVLLARQSVETSGFAVQARANEHSLQQLTVENQSWTDGEFSSSESSTVSPDDHHQSWFAHGIGYHSNNHHSCYVTAAIVIGCAVALIVVSLFVYKKVKKWRCRTSQARHGARALRCCSNSPYSYARANMSDSDGADNSHDSSSAERRRAPSKQQIVSNLENYRALSFAVNEKHEKCEDRIESWTFASLMYSLEPHGCDGPFFLQVPLMVNLVRDSEGKLLTKLSVWHSASSEGAACSWHYMTDVQVQIGEDDKFVDIELPHLCLICVVAEGRVTVNLIVLPFFTVQQDCNLIVLNLFFERMPETEQEFDRLIERHRLVVEKDAVLARPLWSLTVQSLVQVKCTVPDHLGHCTILSKGSMSLCETLTDKQLMGLIYGGCEPKPRVCGPQVQFVFELAEPVGRGRPLCLRLTYCDCENMMIGNHIIVFNTQFPTSGEMPLCASCGVSPSLVKPTGLPVSSASAICKSHVHVAQRGTHLCCALAAIDIPDIITGIGVWERLAQNWHLTSLDIFKIRRRARTLLLNEEEVFFIVLITQFPDVTIEELVAVAYSVQLEGIAEHIKRNAIQEGQFDVDLCNQLQSEAKCVRKEGLSSGTCCRRAFRVDASCSADRCYGSTVGPLPPTVSDEIERPSDFRPQAVDHRLSQCIDLPTTNVISHLHGNDVSLGSVQEPKAGKRKTREHPSGSPPAQKTDQGSKGIVVPLKPTRRPRLPDPNRSHLSQSRLGDREPQTTRHPTSKAYLETQPSLTAGISLSHGGPLFITPCTSVDEQGGIEMTPLHHGEAGDQATDGQMLCADAFGNVGHCSTSRIDTDHQSEGNDCQQPSFSDEKGSNRITWVNLVHPRLSPGPPTIGGVHVQDDNSDSDGNRESLEEHQIQQPLLDSPLVRNNPNRMCGNEGELNVLNDATVVNPCLSVVVSSLTTDTDEEDLLSFNWNSNDCGPP